MLEPVLPIALYLLFGYTFKLFIKDNSKQLIEFIIFFSLPAIVFNKIYQLDITFEIIKMIFMFNIFILINLLFAYLLAKFLKLEKKLFATFIIIATFGNTSFIGFSYIEAFYGQEYVVYALIYDLFASFLLLVSLGMIIINWGANTLINLKSISKSVFLFPPIVMFFLTLIIKNFEIPNFILNTTFTIGNTLVPIAMIAIGMKLQIKHIFYKINLVSLAMLLKMIIMPIFVYILFLFFYNVEDTWSKVTIIEVAMPPMTMAVVLAIKGGLDETFAINALVLGVLSSLITVTYFFNFLN